VSPCKRLNAQRTATSARRHLHSRTNTIVKERSFVLILLYPRELSATSTRSIQRIRDIYKVRFDQQSVLRVDTVVCVSS